MDLPAAEACRAKEERDNWEKELTDWCHTPQGQERMEPEALRELEREKAMPADAMVSTDIGNSAAWPTYLRFKGQAVSSLPWPSATVATPSPVPWGQDRSTRAARHRLPRVTGLGHELSTR